MATLWTKTDANGKTAVITNDAGTAVIVCDQCPCPPCPPLTSDVSLVSSGISTCSTCIATTTVDGALSAKLNAVGTITPSITLSHAGSSPTWAFLDSSSVWDYFTYNDNACSTFDEDVPDAIQYLLYCDGTTWAISAYGPNTNVLYFYASGTGALPKGTAVANILTTCNQSPPTSSPLEPLPDTGSNFGNAAGFGGIVTLDW